MDLITKTTDAVPAKTTKEGNTTIEVAAGQTLKIETSPDGVEVLSETVPAGEGPWTVFLRVDIHNV